MRISGIKHQKSSKSALCFFGLVFETPISKTIAMTTKSHIPNGIFKILVIENESTFYDILNDILQHCVLVFPFLKFVVLDKNALGPDDESQLRQYDLVFIEDRALLNIEKQSALTDFVLLLNGYFFRDHAVQLKKIIHENSLNLYEHISLTNYTFDLMKLLVVDFIKAKTHV